MTLPGAHTQRYVVLLGSSEGQLDVPVQSLVREWLAEWLDATTGCNSRVARVSGARKDRSQPSTPLPSSLPLQVDAQQVFALARMAVFWDLCDAHFPLAAAISACLLDIMAADCRVHETEVGRAFLRFRSSLTTMLSVLAANRLLPPSVQVKQCLAKMGGRSDRLAVVAGSVCRQHRLACPRQPCAAI